MMGLNQKTSCSKRWERNMTVLKFDGRNLYDAQGSMLGNVRNNDIIDRRGQRVGSIRGRYVYDKDNSLIGSVTSDSVFAADGKRIASVADVRRKIVFDNTLTGALWLYFVYNPKSARLR